MLNNLYNNFFRESAQEAYQYFHDHIRPLPKRPDGSWDISSGAFRNNDVDAFRHAYAAATKTFIYGGCLTEAIGNLHEVYHPDPDYPAQIKNMDLWNNHIGIVTSEYITDELNIDNYKTKIGDAIKYILEHGALITDPLDENKHQFNEDGLEDWESVATGCGKAGLNLLFSSTALSAIYYLLELAAKEFAAAYISPIVFDLDGDGIELINVTSGVNFDLDNNGIAEKTGWLKGDDGFLVRDLNGNGKIDNQTEMFGIDNTSTALQKLIAVNATFS